MMFRSPRLLLIAAALLLAATSLMCSVSGTGEIDPDEGVGAEEDESDFATSNAQFTQTAEARENTLQPTATVPTATSEPTATLPDPLSILSEHSDPSGDTASCMTGSAAADEGSDIVSVQIAEAPASSDHDGLVAVILLAKQLSEFLDIDFSFAVSLSAHLLDGSTTSFLFERHDGLDRIGQEDADHQIIPDTENQITQSADGSAIHVNLPAGTTKIDVFAFHTPSEDAPENYFCDTALNIPVPDNP